MPSAPIFHKRKSPSGIQSPTGEWGINPHTQLPNDCGFVSNNIILSNTSSQYFNKHIFLYVLYFSIHTCEFSKVTFVYYLNNKRWVKLNIFGTVSTYLPL